MGLAWRLRGGCVGAAWGLSAAKRWRREGCVEAVLRVQRRGGSVGAACSSGEGSVEDAQ